MGHIRPANMKDAIRFLTHYNIKELWGAILFMQIQQTTAVMGVLFQQTF